ncbi:MAG: OmpA family protein [Bacteroidetes bacterium]|nr:OmpA family protein [Bacteroidota bacterium]
MEYRLSRFFFLFIGIFVSGKLAAQNSDTARHQKVYTSNSSFRTWSIGVSGGISTTYTLIGYNSRQDFTSPNMQLGYAIYLKDQLTNSFGLQADLMAGKLQGNHAYQLNSRNVPVYSEFDTKLNWSTSLSGNFTIAHWGVLWPYITAGGGIVSYSPVLHSYNKNDILPDQGTLSSFFVPIGLGIKINLISNINLDIGYQVSFVMADNLDGYKYGPTNDRFSYTHIGLEFALGERSKKQLASQLVTIPVQNRILVHDQTLIDTLQEQQTQLAAEKAKNIQLKNDLDAANASLARLTADSDGDGIPDVYDKCPNTPPNTKVDALGCPVNTSAITAEMKAEVTDEDKRILSVAASSVEFYSGTEIISGRSFPNLNAIVRLLQDKKFLLKVDVYADRNVSSDNDFRLAQLRAEAVKNYLVNHGADASKIETEGHRDFPPDTSPLKRRRMANIGQVEFTIVP